MKKTVRTELTIDAPLERVWAMMAGFDNYGDWNPIIRSVAGNANHGELLDITVRLSWLPPVRFRARIDRFRQEKTIGWHAVFLPRLFEAHHWFELYPVNSGKTRFVHCETFSGILGAPLMLMLAGTFRQNYEAMNAALADHSVRK
jgi:hypothetical protein